MTEKQMELFCAYCFNKRAQLEEDLTVLQNNIRWRRIDQIDCLELSIAMARLEMFEEIENSLNALFGVYKPTLRRYYRR